MSKLFRRRLTGLTLDEDPMSPAVMFDNLWVINRNKVSLLIELPHRIAPVDHDIGDQCIGSPKRQRRGIDEFGLYLAPIEFVAITLRAIERTN